MPVQSIFTNGISQDTGGLDVPAFTVIVFAIIYGWILVSALQRFEENLFFQSFGLDPRSTIHSLIIFALITFIFLAFIWYIDELQIIPVSSATASLGEATGGLIAASEDDTSTAVTTQLGQGFKTGHPIVIANVGY